MVASNRSKRYQKEIFKLNGNNLRTPLEIGENMTGIRDNPENLKSLLILQSLREDNSLRKRQSKIEIGSQRLNCRWPPTP